ncbi:MAG: primase-helicase zinc-binding domain-containing protein [Methylophaga sp.]|nr:primase-helicase zinc-binding domain-containing protein [Methylophaga sp.]MDO8827801.1 primase-helicase zinc-binding domain-containing protein [Methylophaga sp.]
MSTQTVDSDVVKNAVRGSWLSVLDSLAPELERAISKPGRHIGCPVHGGKDGFKLFRDADISGGGICNSCGAKPDGFSLLMWLRGWRFPDT